MTKEEETLAFIEKIQNDELYKKSKSIHKGFQYRQFYNDVTHQLMEGQQVRREDANGLVEVQEGFDESTARIVIYNFKDGVLHSENNEPAVQYPGHWEMWNRGVLVKVVANGGDTEEYWENGVPVRIETNLAERRAKEN